MSTPAAVAGDKQLTLELIYGEEASRLDDTTPRRRFSWFDDAQLLERHTQDGETRLALVDAVSGSRKPLYDREAALDVLEDLPGLNAEDAEGVLSGLRVGRDGRGLFEKGGDLYLFELDPLSARRLTGESGAEDEADFSPDGRSVSFVRNNDLYVLDLASGQEVRLTHEGTPELFFGKLDWVYQEEIYGRGNFRGYWWSPDSNRLAFLRLDESDVREFTVVDHMPVELETEVTNYPKAGMPNPTVSLGVLSSAGGEIVWADLSEYEPIQHLIVRVDWLPDSSSLFVQIQDREQTWLDLVAVDPESGATKKILREESPAFVRVLGAPVFLKGDKEEPEGFLWLSEHSGYAHLYRYDLTGALQDQLSDGEWEVRGLHGVDENWAYVTTTRSRPIAPRVERIALDDGRIEALTTRAGSHSARFNDSMTHFVDTWSDAQTPPQIRLHEADGAEVRVLEENDHPWLAEYALAPVEFQQVETRDGFVMEAALIRPRDFDPQKRYPVLQYNYGGPHAPVVRDAWSGATYLWHQMLAQRGYVIWMCDNRSASGKGIAPTWKAYGQLGEIELRDIEDGIAWLKRKDWVDPERIGIWGWSYGGFMASYALTHSETFAMGIAGAPVTDWRLYDTVYTERYMRMPQNNEEGYDSTSVVKAAADLVGRLLLIHGTIDDNVHLQNTVQLAYALQKAGKQFDLMIYPKSRHGVRDDAQLLHLRQLMTRFVEDHL